MRHFVKKEYSIYAMDKNNSSVLTVESGDEIIFETKDCFSDQITNEQVDVQGIDWNQINPATGPVFVKNAQVGDILAVKIKTIEIDDTATLFTGKDLGVIGDELEETTIRRLPIVDGKIEFSSNIHLPLNKMIGVIGTAPAEEKVSCGTPDLHGGNMDCKEITEGVTLFLPVNVEGALLALGDLHAAMADGEVSVCGGEVAGQVTVEVYVLKGENLPTPFLVNKEKIMTLASEVTLDEAYVLATKNMLRFVEKYTSLSKGNATHLLSLAGDLRICQVVDPKKTVRMELPLKYLEQWRGLV